MSTGAWVFDDFLSNEQVIKVGGEDSTYAAWEMPASHANAMNVPRNVMKSEGRSSLSDSGAFGIEIEKSAPKMFWTQEWREGVMSIGGKLGKLTSPSSLDAVDVRGGFTGGPQGSIYSSVPPECKRLVHPSCFSKTMNVGYLGHDLVPPGVLLLDVRDDAGDD